MAKVVVNVKGKSYPCRATMGAARRFKKETGREASTLKEDELDDFCTYLWCCVASSCAADGIDFPYNIDDFADRLEIEDLQAWASLMAENMQAEGKKKAAKR